MGNVRAARIRTLDTRAPGFAEECRRQCRHLTEAEWTEAARKEAAFWERVSTGAWDELG